MRLKLSLIFTFFYITQLSSQVANIYTGGKAPCNGQELTEALNKAGCADGNCQEYKQALERFNKLCRKKGGKSTEEGTDPTVKNDLDGEQIGPDKNIKPSCQTKKGILFYKNNNGYYQFEYCPLDSPPKCGYCISDSKRKINGGNYVIQQPVLRNKLLTSYKYLVHTKEADNKSESLEPDFLKDKAFNWLTSETDETSKYEFKFIVPGERHAWLVVKTRVTPISEFESSFFKETDNIETNNKKKKFLDQLAKVAFEYPDFKIVIPPKGDNWRAVVKWRSNTGKFFLIGIGYDGNFYKPVNLASGTEDSRELLKELQNENNEVLNEILETWYKTGERKSIIASVSGGSPREHENPLTAWSSFDNAQFSEKTFILNTGEIRGNNILDISAEWYNEVKHLNSPHLAMLAVADPYCKILQKNGNKITIVTGDPDNIYLIEVNRGSNEIPPICKPIIDAERKKERARSRAILCRDNPNFFNSFYSKTVTGM